MLPLLSILSLAWLGGRQPAERPVFSHELPAISPAGEQTGLLQGFSGPFTRRRVSYSIEVDGGKSGTKTTPAVIEFLDYTVQVRLHSKLSVARPRTP